MALEDLTKFTHPGEKILFRFGIGPVFYLWQVVACGVVFVPLGLFFRDNAFFWIPIAIGGGLTLLRVTLTFLFTHYFITENRIYRKTGFLFRKVIEVEREEIVDIRSKQGIVERFVFFTGTLEFNTEGSFEIELRLPRVQAPYTKKRKIQLIWSL